MRKKIWRSKSLSKNIKITVPKFQDQFDKLVDDVEYQAGRLGFDLADDATTKKLLEVGSAPMAADMLESATEALYAERFLALAYIQSLITFNRGSDVDVVEALCLGNWLVGVLGGMDGSDRGNLLCPSCIIDGYKESIARTGGAGRSAKLKVLEAETIRLYEAGKWDSTPLAAQEIAPLIVAFSAKEGPRLMPSTTKPLEWIRAYLNNMGPA